MYIVINYEDALSIMTASEFKKLQASQNGLLSLVCDVVNIIDTEEEVIYWENDNRELEKTPLSDQKSFKDTHFCKVRPEIFT